jgi:hypothetical protein
VTDPREARIREALSVISREAPCPHESWEHINATRAKCADCGVNFAHEHAHHARDAAKAFDAATDAILAALDEAHDSALESAAQHFEGVNRRTARVLRGLKRGGA